MHLSRSVYLCRLTWRVRFRFEKQSIFIEKTPPRLMVEAAIGGEERRDESFSGSRKASASRVNCLEELQLKHQRAQSNLACLCGKTGVGGFEETAPRSTDRPAEAQREGTPQVASSTVSHAEGRRPKSGL
jgi:hypothetical protein